MLLACQRSASLPRKAHDLLPGPVLFPACQIVDVIENDGARLGIEYAEDVLVHESALVAFDGDGLVAFELIDEASADLIGYVSLARVRAPVMWPVLAIK